MVICFLLLFDLLLFVIGTFVIVVYLIVCCVYYFFFFLNKKREGEKKSIECVSLEKKTLSGVKVLKKIIERDKRLGVKEVRKKVKQRQEHALCEVNGMFMFFFYISGDGGDGGGGGGLDSTHITQKKNVHALFFLIKSYFIVKSKQKNKNKMLVGSK